MRIFDDNKRQYWALSLFVFSYLIILLTILQLDAIASFLFYVSFFLIVALWIISQTNWRDKGTFLVILITSISLLNVLLNATIFGAHISLNYLKKWIMFISTVFLFDAGDKIKTNEFTEKCILTLNFILSVVLIGLYFKLGKELYRFDGKVGDYLVFNLSNPNKAGMYLAVISIYNFNCAKRVKKFVPKMLVLALNCVILYFLFLTKCRTAIIALALFMIVFFFKGEFLFKKNKRCKIISFLVVVVPICFACLYMFAVNNKTITDLLSFMIEDGKSLDSRYYVWTNAFKEFFKSPILGAYAQISGGTGMSQMHNIGVDILSSYGVVVLIVVMVWLYRILIHTMKKCEINTKKYLYVFSIITAILLGCGEAALFSGAAGYNILVFGFILLAGSEKNEKTIDSKNYLKYIEKIM